MKRLKLVELKSTFSILRMSPTAKLPPEIFEGEFFSVSKSLNELSIVCSSEIEVPGCENRQDGWSCLKVDGELDFSMTGVLSSIAIPLSKGEISIFAVSTYDTDYVLLKTESLERAKEILAEAGFEMA